MIRVSDLTRAIARPYGLDPEIWITEANVWINDPNAPGDAVIGPMAVTLDQQAAFVIQTAAIARSAGVRALAYYRAVDVWENGRYWGLFRQNWVPKPALFAFATAATWLSHARFVATTHPIPDVSVVQFARDGDTIVVAWTTGQTMRTIRLGAPPSGSTLVTPDGRESHLASVGGQVEVTIPSAPPGAASHAPLAPPMIVVSRNYSR